MDGTLIQRARAGDEGALERLIVAYQQPVGRFVVSQIGPGDDYRDVCQATFMSMVRGLSRLRTPEAFEPWLYRIARNACRDHLRRKRWRRRLFVSLETRHKAVQAEQPLVASTPGDELQATLEAVGAGLAPSHRALLALSLEQPRSYEELARLTHGSAGSVRNRLFRARERLRQLVAGRRPDDEP